MRQRIFALLFSLSVCALCGQPLQAQTTSKVAPDYDRQYYLFVSPTLVTHRDQQTYATAIGAGWDRFFSQRITVGLELADSVTHDKFVNPLTQKPERGASRIFWGALNGAYHFRRKDSSNQMRPFVTAGCGISGLNGAGVDTHFNYGAGFNHWHTQHLGVRVEVRRFINSGDPEGRFTGARFGLVIR